MISTITPSSYSSLESQKIYIDSSKRQENAKKAELFGMKFIVFPNVYGTSGDTELMGQTVRIGKKETFLEIGTGCGIVALYLSIKASYGMATDINPIAVKNAEYNARELGISNVNFLNCNLFGDIRQKFDVIIFNPPYTNHRASDKTETMFWDTNNRTKIDFFRHAGKYMKQDGRIYFGWADFNDLDIDLPFRLSRKENMTINRIARKESGKGYSFYVFELQK